MNNMNTKILTSSSIIIQHVCSNLYIKKSGVNLDLWQDGQDRRANAEEHVDADEDLVLGAAIRVGVVDVEHDQRHQRQQVAHRGDRQQSCEYTAPHIIHTLLPNAFSLNSVCIIVLHLSLLPA